MRRLPERRHSLPGSSASTPYGKRGAFGRKAAGKNVVDQKTVNSTVAVFKRVQKNEPVGDNGGVNHGGHIAGVHTLMSGYQALHQVGQILRLRTCEMYSFPLPGDCLSDIVLARPVIGVSKPLIDNSILKFDQAGFRKIFLLGQLEQRCKSPVLVDVGLICSISKRILSPWCTR